MLTKNRVKIIAFFLINIFLFNLSVYADEFNITAKEILIDKENEILTGTGSVQAVDSEGKQINADKIIYEKSKEFLLAEGNVIITDIDGNILKTNKATYDKINEEIFTYNNTEIKLIEGYKLISENVFYKTDEKILNSNEQSIFTDSDGNIIKTDMFQYNINNNLFSSIGEIKIVDKNKNKYFFKQLHVDTNKKEMIGSDVSVILDQDTFGVSNESDPRFVANNIFITERKSELSKGVFTVCKKREGKCPPWLLKAKKISHDKAKKTIYYDHATLKIYDIPVFYFPKFFHPDPTVKRQSGLLAPFFTNTTTVGAGFALPYYWAISNNKDLTFTPKIYTKENLLILNEYRQAFKNGFLTLDTSFTEGYKNTSDTKTSGSRNHIFANLDLNFSEEENFTNNLLVKVQRSSNDTYFRIHDIKTSLVNPENTDLESKIKYNYDKNNTYFSIASTVHENLREKTNSRYEYILPNIMYGKTFLTQSFGTLDFQANAFYNNYDVNKHKTFLTNDIIWSPFSYITKKRFC